MIGNRDRELRLLSEVTRTPETTQRSLSRRVGIALGMTNLLVRNLARKGYLRITQASWNGWLYTLTPRGFSRKAQLTAAYIQRVLEQYQWVRQTLREELEPLGLNAESQVAIYGTGVFGELVYLGIKELGIEEVDVFASRSSLGGKFLGVPVKDVMELRSEQYARVVVASLENVEERCAELREAGVPVSQMVIFFPQARDVDEASQEGV